MSQIVEAHSSAPHSRQDERKKEGFSYVNVMRSIFTEFSAIGMMVFLATQLHDGNYRAAILIASAGSGAILGLFVVFHLYVRRKTH